MMIVPLAVDRLTYTIARWIAQTCSWSPIGAAVLIQLEDGRDRRLLQRRVRGVVRAFDPDAFDKPLLIQLDEILQFEARDQCRYIEFVVATPALRWHSPSRLLLTWAVVRVIDASSFVDQEFESTIGIGRLVLL
jgi:hypothetical protein